MDNGTLPFLVHDFSCTNLTIFPFLPQNLAISSCHNHGDFPLPQNCRICYCYNFCDFSCHQIGFKKFDTFLNALISQKTGVKHGPLRFLRINVWHKADPSTPPPKARLNHAHSTSGTSFSSNYSQKCEHGSLKFLLPTIPTAKNVA